MTSQTTYMEPVHDALFINVNESSDDKKRPISYRISLEHPYTAKVVSQPNLPSTPFFRSGRSGRHDMARTASEDFDKLLATDYASRLLGRIVNRDYRIYPRSVSAQDYVFAMAEKLAKESKGVVPTVIPLLPAKYEFGDDFDIRLLRPVTSTRWLPQDMRLRTNFERNDGAYS